MIFGREQLNIERETLLWTNPNPTSAFSAQTLNVDLSGYDFVKIKYAVQIQNLSLEHCIQFAYFKLDDLPKEIDAVNGNVCLGGLLANYGFIRAIAYDNRSLKFGSGYGNQTVNQNWNVPFEIYGIKGRRLPVTFPTDEELLWENPNPTSNFSPIGLPMDIHKYAFAKIEYKLSNSYPYKATIIIPTEEIMTEQLTAGIGSSFENVGGAGRSIRADTTTLYIGNGYVGASTDNSKIIPLKIYGIGRKQ